MFGVFPIEFSAPARRFAVTLLLGVAVLFLTIGAAPASGQETPPAEPSASPDPNTSALPTDPAAAPTIQTPSTSLIPVQPLSVLDEPRSPAASNGPGANPSVIPADPLAIPPPAEPVPGSSATTTNNIGVARRFQYSFLFSLGATFDDNLFLGVGSAQKESDVYFTIQPSVSLGFGGGVASTGSDNYVRFTYSPQALLYSDHSELDAVQHFVNLSGAYHFTRLTLTGSQSIQILDNTDVGNPQAFGQSASATGFTPTQTDTAPASSVNIDASQRSRLNIYNTVLDANYAVSDKVSYDVGAQFNDLDYQTLLSSSSLSSSFFFNYTPTGKTTAGLGATIGYTFAEKPTPDQTFEQGNFRVSYLPGSKLSASGQVGLEVRQSNGVSGSDVTPIFELSASYTPFDGTSFSLGGSRQVETSAVSAGQNYTTTGLSLGLGQRFFQRLFTRLSVSYSYDSYTSELAGTTATRNDNYISLQPSLDFNARDNLTVGGFYSFRHNTSSGGGRSFTDNQLGIRLSVSF